jgi:magnesium transporter
VSAPGAAAVHGDGGHGGISFETAAEHATARVPVFPPQASAERMRAGLLRERFDSATHVAVCDDGRFRGVLRIEDLLAAPGDATAGELMDAEAPVVAPGVDQEVAAWTAVQRRESALDVVDADGRFVGLIPPHALLSVLLWEHEEDLSRLGGFLRDAATARASLQEAVLRRFWHRVPWLVLGLAGALAAADIVASFQTRLQERLILAFFIPGIVYLADAVGTQTETLVVRGLSVGLGVRAAMWGELLTGLMIGIFLALVSFPLLLWRWGQPDVALGVSLALLAACSVATLIAMILPWILDRFGLDPAFGTGPLATVIQDLLSIVIYFAIATVVVS